MIRHQKENTYEISRTQERRQREKKKTIREIKTVIEISKSTTHTAEKNRTEKGEQNKIYILKTFIGLKRKQKM